MARHGDWNGASELGDRAHSNHPALGWDHFHSASARLHRLGTALRADKRDREVS